ncbi:hypothetical protein [Oenococcus sp.]|uniref:hypothetical protein n=1 Tax=Oenococcus sp. TaxID=1979414 RepID=UPI0039ECDEEC
MVLQTDTGMLNSAGFKAKSDISRILKSEGYEVLTFDITRWNKLLRPPASYFFWKNKLSNIPSLLVYQYPTYSHVFTDMFFKVTRKFPVKTIGLVHDVESLRLFTNSVSNQNKEIVSLNRFDALIVHNNRMKKWLSEHGVRTPMICLQIFDYLNDAAIRKETPKFDLVMAGNLNKVPYISNWQTTIKIQLLGPNPASSYPDNINYVGNFSPNEVPQKLDAKFGLVWDGDSLSSGAGVYGEYTKYNNPHKTSLYLSMGIPVIVWDQAAIADFVLDYQVGITVSNLNKLEERLKSMTNSDYAQMKSNAENIAKDLRSAKFTQVAIAQAEQLLDKR